MATAKILSLLIKTAAKPLANSLKREAVKSPAFKAVCVNVAQGYHRVEETLKMRFLGYKLETIRPLNDARAVEVGSNFLAEFFIFGVAGTLVVAETVRSTMKTSQRNKKIDQDISHLQSNHASTLETLDLLSDQLAIVESENQVLRDTAKSLILLVDVMQAQGRAWFPGLRNSEVRDEMAVVKLNLEKLDQLAGKQNDALVLGELNSIKGTITP